MEIKNVRFFVLAVIGLCLFSSACFAQEVKESEANKVYKRAESFLQTIRDKKWDEIYKFVVIVIGKKDNLTKDRMNISDQDSEKEIQQKVGNWFKKLYGVEKPGKILQPISFNADDKTLARISYIHGDIDGFHMRKVNGEWYYTLDYK